MFGGFRGRGRGKPPNVCRASYERHRASAVTPPLPHRGPAPCRAATAWIATAQAATAQAAVGPAPHLNANGGDFEGRSISGLALNRIQVPGIHPQPRSGGNGGCPQPCSDGAGQDGTGQGGAAKGRSGRAPRPTEGRGVGRTSVEAFARLLKEAERGGRRPSESVPECRDSPGQKCPTIGTGVSGWWDRRSCDSESARPTCPTKATPKEPDQSDGIAGGAVWCAALKGRFVAL